MKYFFLAILAVTFCTVLSHDIFMPNKPSIDITCTVSNTNTFKRIGYKYYIIGQSKVTWFEALHICRRYGGDLVLIESPSEMNSINSYLKSEAYGDQWFWTSGNDLITNHNFMSTVNGLPLQWTFWSPGQPDLPGVEHCVHLWFINGEYTMNNRDCKAKAYYICQANSNHTRCHSD